MSFRTIISLLLLAWCCGQAGRAQGEGLRPFRVVCYNVENYFDCVDDSLTDDSEFLPGGIRGWNHARYRLKQAHVARVLAAIAGWDTPALVGLCEVESRKALTDLVRYSPLRSFGYEFIHFDSPDVRGVDVALLYHPYRFFPIRAQAVPVVFADPDERPTRDILYVQGSTMYDDTLHVLLHHAPSRMGGEAASAHLPTEAWWRCCGRVLCPTPPLSVPTNCTTSHTRSMCRAGGRTSMRASGGCSTKSSCWAACWMRATVFPPGLPASGCWMPLSCCARTNVI